jgi:hypothetical protein
VTTSLGTMVASNGKLAAADEAELVGRSASAVSRARQDPTHPANGPDAEEIGIGRRTHTTAPRDQILTWWGQRAPAGRARTTPAPPAGLTPTQWAALRALAAGGTASNTTRRRLAARGLTDDTGQLTPAGRALLAQHATDGAHATES